MCADTGHPQVRPLKQRLRKTMVEYFAMLILQHCFPGQYGKLQKGESPDLQSADASVGVEVTEAISQQEARFDSERARGSMAPQGKSGTGERRKEGAQALEIDLYPLKTLEDEKRIWQNALRKKMNKLSYYRKRHLSQLNLCIVYDDPPIPVPPAEWKGWLDEILQDYDDRYQILYLCYPYGLIVYDLGQNSFQILRLDPTVFEALKGRAIELVEQQNSWPQTES